MAIFYRGFTFKAKYDTWKIVNYDDCSGCYICKGKESKVITYFSSSEIYYYAYESKKGV